MPNPNTCVRKSFIGAINVSRRSIADIAKMDFVVEKFFIVIIAAAVVHKINTAPTNYTTTVAVGHQSCKLQVASFKFCV